MNPQGEALRRTRNRPERAFWVGLSCAALVHAAVIVEIGRAPARFIGERNGAPEALSVEIVDAAQLKSRSTVPLREPSAAAQAAPAAPPPSEAPVAAPVAPRVADKAPDWPIDRQGLEAIPLEPGSKPADTAPSTAKPKPNATPRRPRLSLNLDLSPDIIGPAGPSTDATRPPDITRSGENDEFGRRVIRALRQTMPAPRGEIGRVTVRLLLSDTGNLAELQLVRAAEDPILTQSIIFAVKQSSFPIPPVGSTLSDRTFLVTYIYR